MGAALLAAKSSAEAAPWHNERVLYLAGIVAALDESHPPSLIVFKKSSQAGGSARQAHGCCVVEGCPIGLPGSDHPIAPIGSTISLFGANLARGSTWQMTYGKDRRRRSRCHLSRHPRRQHPSEKGTVPMPSENSAALEPMSLCRLHLETRYSRIFCTLNARLYGHINSALTATAVLLGSGALGSVLAGSATWTAVTAIALAIVAVVQMVYSPAAREANFCAHARRYAELYSARDDFSRDDFERRMNALRAELQPGEIDSLSQPAYNATLREAGYREGFQETTRWQRIAFALA
jgi:hypothetical protein